tara:strand:- start:2493 stop:2711 length:219 start_codon:yes stop_codon:yes gene_type:complete
MSKEHPSVYSVAKRLDETKEAFFSLDHSLSATLVDMYRSKKLTVDAKQTVLGKIGAVELTLTGLSKELEEIK